MVVNGGPRFAEDYYGLKPYLAGQNSLVQQLLVTFNMPVTLEEGAFTLDNLHAEIGGAINCAGPKSDRIRSRINGVWKLGY